MPGPSGYVSGIAFPDASTPQSRGDWRKPEKRPGIFPYDRPVTYGSPRGIDDTGSGYERPGPNAPITPKDTRHTPWDPDSDLDEALALFGEVSGTPYMLNKASDTGMPMYAPSWQHPDEDDMDKGLRHRELMAFMGRPIHDDDDDQSMEPWSTVESLVELLGSWED